MPETIQDKLNKIKNDNWLRKLREISKGMDAYNNPSNSSFSPKQIEEKYLNPILPAYWEVFHTHNISRRRENLLPNREGNNDLPPCYDVGIFLVGFSSIPIVLSLAEIQPNEQIYFLYSRETEHVLHEISDRISVMLGDSNSPLINLVEDTVLNNLEHSALKIDNPSDPVETFKRIKEIVNQVGNKSVALDLTGGKKTMIGGGFIAGSILGFADAGQQSTCDMFYIDSLAFDPNRGTPEPGTEFLSLLENPYDVYNVQYTVEAEKLFKQHNYEAAAILWEGVDEKLGVYAKRYGLEKEQITVQKDLYMADCYGLWDAFDYIEAKDSKEDHGDLWGYNAKHTYNLHPTVIDVLEVLSEIEDPRTLFHEETQIIHYTLDRYQNGIRRMQSDRFDDAIVRFTQVIEILCRYQIYQIATNGWLTADDSHDPVTSQCCLDERWHLSELIRFLFTRHRDYNHYYHIANEDERLKITEYGYNRSKEITDLIEVRNDFVHVKRNPAWQDMEKNAKNLQSLARNFLEKFSSDYCAKTGGLSFEKLLKLHEFQQLD